MVTRIHPKRVRLTALSLAIALLVALVVTSAQSAGPRQAGPPFVFRALDDDQLSAAAPEPGVLRRRAILVEWSRLAENTTETGAPAFAPRLALNLFDDQVVVATKEHVEYRGPGDYTWVGRLPDDPVGYAILTAHEGVLVGLIAAGPSLYQIRFSGVQYVQEVDPQAFTPTASDAVIVEEPSLEAPPGDEQPDASIAQAGSPVVDLMILYTPAAQAAAGGEAAMRALVQLSTDSANFALAQSQVEGRFRLVRAQVINYVDSGSLNTDLGRLATANDGFLDEAQSLQARYGADLVSLFVTNYPAPQCGLGQLLQSATGRAQYSALTFGCGAGFSLAHELGHNLGLCHGTPKTGSCLSRKAFHPYANGYQDPQGRFRDIMAYADECAVARGCPRIPRFSNPRITFNGAPVGSVEADNARALNGTMRIAAARQPTRVTAAVEPPVVDIAAEQLQPLGSAVAGAITSPRLLALDGNTLVVAGVDHANKLSLTLWRVGGDGVARQSGGTPSAAIDAIGTIRDVSLTALSATRIVTRIGLNRTCSSGSGIAIYQAWTLDEQGTLNAAPERSPLYCENIAQAALVALGPDRLAALLQPAQGDPNLRNLLGIVHVSPTGRATYTGGLRLLPGGHGAMTALDGVRGDGARVLVAATSRADRYGVTVASWQVSADGRLGGTQEQLISSGVGPAVVAAGEEYAVVADQASDGALRLTSWKATLNNLGQVYTRSDLPVSTVAAAPMSAGRAAVVVHSAERQQAIQLWSISNRGQLVLLGQTSDAGQRGAGPLVSVGLSATRLAVADSSIDGNLRLQIWEARPTVEREGRTAYLTVKLNTPALDSVTVDYAVTGGTATNGVDYSLSSGRISFAPGELVHRIAVPLSLDTLVEPAETVEVSLKSSVGARMGSSSRVTLTIANTLQTFLPFTGRKG